MRTDTPIAAAMSLIASPIMSFMYRDIASCCGRDSQGMYVLGGDGFGVGGGSIRARSIV